MSDRPETMDKCPPVEELSAWYDSELRDGVLEAHVARCARCQQTVDSYRDIDRQIQGTLAATARHPDAVSRIKRGSLGRIQERRDRILYLNSWGRIAAAAAAACVVVAVMTYFRDFSAGRLGDAQPLAAADPATALQPAAAVWEPAAVQLLACGAGGDVLNPAAAAVTPAADTAVVHHVWVGDDPVAAVATLTGLVAPAAKPELEALIQQTADRYTVELLLPGTQLQGLVNRLDAKGLKLLSPTGPQPGAPSADAPAATPVRYLVDFVRR